jgi:hypothetical protein
MPSMLIELRREEGTDPQPAMRPFAIFFRYHRWYLSQQSSELNGHAVVYFVVCSVG